MLRQISSRSSIGIFCPVSFKPLRGLFRADTMHIPVVAANFPLLELYRRLCLRILEKKKKSPTLVDLSLIVEYMDGPLPIKPESQPGAFIDKNQFLGKFVFATSCQILRRWQERSSWTRISYIICDGST